MTTACAVGSGSEHNPFSASQIERLLLGAVHPERIIEDAQRECISFRVGPEQVAAFRRAGAPTWFGDVLQQVCYSSPRGSSPPHPYHSVTDAPIGWTGRDIREPSYPQKGGNQP